MRKKLENKKEEKIRIFLLLSHVHAIWGRGICRLIPAVSGPRLTEYKLSDQVYEKSLLLNDVSNYQNQDDTKIYYISFNSFFKIFIH